MDRSFVAFRSRPLRRGLAFGLCLALAAAGCAQSVPDEGDLQGLWRSEGFGLYLDVDGSVDVYEHTSVSCALVARGSSRGSGEILGLTDGGRLLLSETNRVVYFDPVEVLPERCVEPFATDDPATNLEVLVASMEEHYAFFELRDPGWGERAETAAGTVDPDLDPPGLLDLFTGLLGPLGDAQVRISGPDRGILPEGAWSAGALPSGVVALAERIRSGRVPGLTEVEVTADRGVVSGWLGGGVGYLAVNRLAGFGADVGVEERALADALFAELSRFAEADSLIVDLRVNRGGRESLALLVASRFVAEETLVATRTVRVGGTDRYVDAGDLVARPLPAGPFPARLAVLVGPGTAGAAELLVLALREVPGTVLVGDRTAGSLSPMLLRELPNGWTLGLSHQRVLDSDGVLWEGRGIPVDHEVGEEAAEDRDPVLETAVALLGGGQAPHSASPTAVNKPWSDPTTTTPLGAIAGEERIEDPDLGVHSQKSSSS